VDYDVVVIGAARAWWPPAFLRRLTRRWGAAVVRAPSGAHLAGAG